MWIPILFLKVWSNFLWFDFFIKTLYLLERRWYSIWCMACRTWLNDAYSFGASVACYIGREKLLKWWYMVCTYASEYYSVHVHIRCLHTLTSPLNLNHETLNRNSLTKIISYVIFGRDKLDIQITASKSSPNKIKINSNMFCVGMEDIISRQVCRKQVITT
jgi:hypothetical protein